MKLPPKAAWALVSIALTLTLVAAWMLIEYLAGQPGGDQEVVAQRRSAILQFLTLCGLLAGLWMTLRTFSLSRRAHRTSVFVKAVECFNTSASEALRIAGIYSLYDLVQEDAAYWPRIDRILGAHVVEISNSGKSRRELEDALWVLGRRKRAWAAEVAILDLSNSDLSHLDLTGGDFSQTRFDRANLTATRLTDCKLVAATFVKCPMDSARLTGANVRAADFSKATLDGVDFLGAITLDANLTGASLASPLNLSEAQRAVMRGGSDSTV